MVRLFLLKKLSDQVPLRHQLWLGNVPFLLLPHRCRHVSLRGDPGGLGVLVTTARKREARAMKVVIVDQRKGFWGVVLRRLYGIRKVEE